jgi:hypothetical protein
MSEKLTKVEWGKNLVKHAISNPKRFKFHAKKSAQPKVEKGWYRHTPFVPELFMVMNEVLDVEGD